MLVPGAALTGTEIRVCSYQGLQVEDATDRYARQPLFAAYPFLSANAPIKLLRITAPATPSRARAL